MTVPVTGGLCVDARIRRGDFALDVRAGFSGVGVTAILGGSGAGKSTLLRVIAGLEKDALKAGGRACVRVRGETWADSTKGLFLPPQKRSVGYVFQDYALFDHMSVAANIAYGLSGTSKARRERAQAWIERMRLTGLEERTTDDLSGGQRQRVALARALAPDPEVLLLDEPFSAVDAHLKAQLVEGLRDVLKDRPRTVLMVTHALEEARAVADNIAVMAGGRLIRLGAANAVIEDPRSFEAAVLTGWRNLLPVKWVAHNRLGGSWGALDLDIAAPLDAEWVGIKPERIRMETNPGNGLPATVRAVRELGPVREIECALGDGHALIVHKAWDAPLPAPGTRIGLCLPAEHLRLLGHGRSIVLGDEDVTACTGVEVPA